MFEKEIQALTERTMTQLGEPGIALTLDQIEESNIHPAFLRYITAEMEFMIFRERRKLLRDAFFDYSDPEVEPYFEKIAGVIIRKKKLTHEDLKRLVYQAAAMNINYLLRPRWTINRFVFNKVEARSIEEVRLLLNYSYFYKYIRKVILSVFDIKKKKTVEHHEFRDLLNNLDRELLETQKSYILKDAIESMSSFFALAGDEEGTLRTGAVILFLKEKGMNTAVADIRKQLSDDPEAAFPVVDYQSLLLGDPAEELVEEETTGAEPSVPGDEEEPLPPVEDTEETSMRLPGTQALDDLAEPPAEVQEFEEAMPDQQAGYEEMTESFGDDQEATFEPAEERLDDVPEEMDTEESFAPAGDDPGQPDEAFDGEADDEEAEPAPEDFGEPEDISDELSEEDFELVEVDEDAELTTEETDEDDAFDAEASEEHETVAETEAPAESEAESAAAEAVEEEPGQADEEMFEEVVPDAAGDTVTDEDETLGELPDTEELTGELTEEPSEADEEEMHAEDETLLDELAETPTDDEEEVVGDATMGESTPDEVVAEEPQFEEPVEHQDAEAARDTSTDNGEGEPEVEIAAPEEAQEEMEKVVGDSEVPASSPGDGTPANPQTIKPSGLPEINEEELFVNPDDIDPGVAQVAAETDEAIKEGKFAEWGPEDRSRDDVFSYFTPQESQKLINELFNEDHVDFVNTLENIGECANHLVALKRITLILQAAEIKPESRSARLLIERIVSYFAEKGR